MRFPQLTRREFLHLSAATFLGIPYLGSKFNLQRQIGLKELPSLLLGRITRSSIPIFQEPDKNTTPSGKLFRDDVVSLEELIYSPYEPRSNPRWYRIDSGYIHSAYVQKIAGFLTNPDNPEIPANGGFGRITVPFTQSWYINRNGIWRHTYRLYYDTVHWIIGTVENPDGEIMVKLKDEWLKIYYYVLAKHIQLLDFTNFSPISPDIPAEKKEIHVSIDSQTLIAFENQEAVFACPVSTGVRYRETPQGEYRINRKYPSKHMGNGAFTSAISAYELPGVPWVSFFSDSGAAFHGAYWHDNFGNPMSHGCVNMRCEDALWLFRWAEPFFSLSRTEQASPYITSDEGVRVTVT